MDNNKSPEVPDLAAETFVSGGGKASLAHGQSFLSYMSTITETDKMQLLNLGQYVLLAVIPITILLKLLKMFTPLEDPSKGSVEILVEVIAQLLVIVMAMYFIHKMIIYLPTYSKRAYDNVNLLTMVIPFVFILFTLETNIGDKVSTLLERAMVAVGLNKEPMTEMNDESASIHTPPSLALEPPQGPQMSNPMNTLPEVNSQQNVHQGSMGTQQQPQMGNMMLQNEIMASNSYGNFASF
jgi:hypothetical protein